jgi:hypothetical protein
MKKHFALLTISLFAFFVNFAQPVIQSFAPASGPVNTPVTITGTGFSTVASDNIVFFGATRATVAASTATTISVTVPAGATYEPITVTINNLTAYSILPFLATTSGSGTGLPFSSTSFVPKQDFITGYYPHGLALADFNLDGKPDLLVSKGSSATVSVLTNTSSGNTLSFAPGLELAAPGDSHEEAAAGDLDGDGKLDFVLASTFGANSVSVFRNTTAGSAVSFAGKIDLPVVASPYDVAIGDVDGDGKPDVVAVNSGTGVNVVSVFRNTSTPGNISFATRIDLDGGLGPFSIEIADLDADGKPEIVVTGQYSSSSALSVLKNSSAVGNISFQTPITLANIAGPFTVAVGDLNGDGKPDLVASSAFSNAIIVKRNISTPGVLSFSAQQDYFSTGSYPEGVAITDFDGDGKPDVVATNNDGNSVSVLQNTSTTGSISFANHVDYGVGAHPNIVTCGDLDGDGRSDIITANTSESFVSVLRNIIGANVAPAITSFTPGSGVSGTTVIITGENFNGTTAVKFGGVPASSFTINSNTSITAIVAQGVSGDVSVTTSFGTAVHAGFVFNGPIINSFTPAIGIAGITVTITGTNFTGANAVKFGGVPAASFTVTSATRISAVVGNGASGDVSVTTPNGTAMRAGFSFGAPTITSFTPAVAAVGATVTITGTNFSTIVSDNRVFFGAVKATVVTSSATQLSVVVPAGATYAPITVTTNYLTAYSSQPFSTSFSANSKQITTASFAVAGNYGTGGYPRAVYTSDLNDDGKPELITVNGTGNSVSVLKNLSSIGNVSFENKLDLPVGVAPSRIAIGDLDGDGRPDLAVINSGSGNASALSVFRNTSTGGSLSFGTRSDISTGRGSYDVAIGDINGDGKPDIVVTSGNSGFFSIFQNTTVGTTISFAPKQDFTLLLHPDALVVADFDKDGRTDIVTSNFSDDNVSVYRNISTGGILSLASRIDYPSGNFSSDVSTGDLDLDGKLDLIVRTDGQFSFMKNNSTPGAISFASAQGFTLPATNAGVGDLNGDGKPDLCSGQSLNGKISIFENTNTAPGTVSLGASVDFTTGNYDTFVTIGDLDGDGKPEIAATNTLLYTVTILRNKIDETVVIQLSPANARKGDTIIIYGANFSGASAVKFGGTTASSFTVVSPTRIDAVVAAGASGDVTVTAPAGTGSLSGFRFIPEITANGAISFCNNSSVVLTSTAAVNNQWFKDGSGIIGATGTTYQATTTGTYTVKTISNNITTSSAAGIVVNVITVPTPAISRIDTLLTSSAATGNQWYFNGSAVQNATAQTIRPLQDGNYTVQVTANGCTSALSAVYSYVLTGIIDLGNNQFIKLWPNPVRSVMILQWNVPNLQTLSVEVRDIRGQLALFNRNIRSGETINLSALATGTYFVKMYGTNRNPVGTLKILKVN